MELMQSCRKQIGVRKVWQLTVLGLLVQGFALILTFARFGRSWFARIGAIFTVIAVIYHGLGEILVSLFPSEDPYRPLFAPKYLGEFVFLISMAILIFTVSYVWASGDFLKASRVDDVEGLALTRRVLDYRVLLVVTAPLLLATIRGQGYAANGGFNQATGVGATLGLTQQFFILSIVLSAFGLALRWGRKWILPILIAQSLLLGLVGERLVVVFGAVMLLFALSRVGLKMRRSAVVTGLILLALFSWVITAARGAEGRYTNSSGASVRLSFLAVGLTHLVASSTGDEFANTLGYRLDGNSYGAMCLQALSNGSSPVGLTPLIIDVRLAVPSFLYPQKDHASPDLRSEKLYVEEHLPISELETRSGAYMDIVSTQLGGLTGILGPAGLLLCSFLLGLVFAFLDRWIAQGTGPVRTLISLGAVYSVLDYEGSWDTYSVTARGIIVLIGIALPISFLGRYVRRGRRLSLKAFD
jgi:hypothetical protein